ncbi:CPBP family intramembrane metalloprotease [Patescibacteria group bacterium]|nr:CPBP family intramembrane metalloprotease [Patescibacteria group bacterium]MBU1672849.1 CPBP family intramembrane metalloprotease [Patescibacteria group bacterium]MBU1963730.1 CPBP family intramembrane metalloprotease [Patescibacteria group bacterium]
MNINWKKILQFLGITFFISWGIALIMYLLDIQFGSLVYMVVLAVVFMPAPAYAVIILQKLVYKKKLSDYGLTLKNINLWGIILTIILMITLVLLTFNIAGLFGNVLGMEEFGRVSFSNSDMKANMQQMLDEADVNSLIGQDAATDVNNLPFTPLLLFFGSIFSGIIVGFSINLIFALGEELGWRGLLLDELRQLGLIKVTLLIGVIWGIWHAPIILQGYNYPGYSWLGALMMILFTTGLTLPFIYARYKTRTVLGAAAFHGMLNGMAGMTIYFIINPNPLFGSMVGLAGIITLALMSLGIVLLDKKFVKNFKTFK